MSNPDFGTFDLVMRDADFVIYSEHQPMTTPGGKELAHYDSRLLKHILIELSMSSKVDLSVFGSFTLFSFSKDIIEQNNNLFLDKFDLILLEDPLLKAKFDPTGKNRGKEFNQILDDPNGNDKIMNLLFLGATVVTKGLKDLFSSNENIRILGKEFPKHREEISLFVREIYTSLPVEKKAAVNLLFEVHRVGVMLPLLLVLSKISPSEYALSVLASHTNNSERSVSVLTNFSTEGFELNPVLVDWEKPEESYALFHEQALKTIEYLSFFENPGKKMSVISELISQGEHERLEFKSTFRWDLRQDKKNPAIEHAALKSITAFLNSDGGDLLIGVEDDGSIIGVERDCFANDDKFLLHVWTLIKTSIGKDISPYITSTLEKFDDKTVCRIQCRRSPKPVFLRQNGYDVLFYIRIGPSSGSLDISEALKYIADHF